MKLQKILKRVIGVVVCLALVLSSTLAQADTYFFHNDHLGTPQVLTDKHQAVVWETKNEPFGSATETVKVVEQNLRFPGQYLDRETGLYYNWYRSYDPVVGRYLTADPLGLYDGPNLYLYGQSTPLMLVDPYGLFTDSIWEKIYEATGGWSPSDTGVDIAAGFGDGISFGITRDIRRWQKTNDEVDECSMFYSSSELAGSLILPSTALAKFTQWFKAGKEFTRNPKLFRFAPFGNRTGHPHARYY